MPCLHIVVCVIMFLSDLSVKRTCLATGKKMMLSKLFISIYC